VKNLFVSKLQEARLFSEEQNLQQQEIIHHRSDTSAPLQSQPPPFTNPTNANYASMHCWDCIEFSVLLFYFILLSSSLFWKCWLVCCFSLACRPHGFSFECTRRVR
jgi:hypothetical protein